MPEWLIHIPRLEFAEPWWLLLLPVVALLWRRQARMDGSRTDQAIMFPGLERLRASGFEAGRWLCILSQWLRRGVIVCSILALAEPRLLFRKTEAESKGIDMVLALDISESMLQRDLTGKSPLDAAREVARSFVLRRSNDRIGLVVFRGKGYTQCPLTLDHAVLAMLLDRLSPAVIRDDGTAIGTAILVAINRLKPSESSHKAVILITDGENNAGEVGPSTAAVLAARNGIRVYVINAGFKIMEDRLELSGESGSHAVTDEESLQSVAQTTGGAYFRVDDSGELDHAIRKIGQQENSRHGGQIIEYRSALSSPLLLVAALLLFVELIVSNTRLLRIP